jgi:hypothetical protein
MTTRLERVQFVVLPHADKVHSCALCHAKLRTGEAGVAIITPNTAHVQHVTCTPMSEDAAHRLLADLRREIT